MNRLKMYGLDDPDKKYEERCLRQLKEWGAPLYGWYCIDIVDVREDDEDAPFSECELCGCSQVRYEHVMEHESYFEPVIVGCICAGIMEGNILRARERERLMKNRSQRRKRFVAKGWNETIGGDLYKDHKGIRVLLHKCSDGYSVQVGGKMIYTYKGKRITDTLTAAYAAFDALDPKEVIT